MKTIVLYFEDWPVREVKSTMKEVLGSFEAHGSVWYATESTTMKGLYCAVHPTGYVLSGVLAVTPDSLVEKAKEFLSKQSKEQIDAVIRAVKETTGAPLE